MCYGNLSEVNILMLKLVECSSAVVELIEEPKGYILSIIILNNFD